MTDTNGTLDAMRNTDTSETPEVAGVVDVLLADLKPHPRNPRKIRPERLEQLKRNLLADAAMLRARPLIALPDGTVIAGNQRLRAATELGWETIPVAYADPNDERATLWAIRDNRGFGEDDVEITGALLSELAAAGADLDLTGYSSSDIDALLAATRPEPPVDPDDAPPLPEGEPSSRLGEVYELGAHRLMCGDATDAAQVAALCTEEAGLVFTDPPYGVNYQGDEDPESLRRRNRRSDGKATVANDALGDEATRALVGNALAALRAHLRKGASFYVCAPSGVSELWFRLAVQDVGLDLRQVIVWVKDVFAFGRQDYHWRHESVLYGWYPGAAHLWLGGRTQDTVWEIPRPKRSEEHPTMKPVALVERTLLNSSGLGDVVLDPFAGSGTTLIAAETLGRRCFAMEIDPRYCDVIRRRYATFTDQPHLAP